MHYGIRLEICMYRAIKISHGEDPPRNSEIQETSTTGELLGAVSVEKRSLRIR